MGYEKTIVYEYNMKPSTTPLSDLLATRQFAIADLYTFALIDGTTLYYTSAGVDVTYGGHTYLSGGQVGPYFEGTGGGKPSFKWVRGLQVDTLQFDVIPKDATIESVSFLIALQRGAFDGAVVTLSRAYDTSATFSAVVGIFTLFVGRVGDITCGRLKATFTINSQLELLNQNMPRNLYQSNCVNTLYDASCTLTKASYAVNGSVAASSTSSLINTTSPSNSTGYFDMGAIAFTSGVNNGVWRTVKAYVHGSPSTITLISPLPIAPATSDTFTIYPGCDKTQSTCTSKFSNLVNFRAMPYVPENSTAV